ncbi:hypothetical protein [Jatrophihabitans sp.]|uniref:hypothetical protein n=1 Tax=Jatrophihabitans sp. TaxID=1932789 RepID=UPI0030C72744
MTAQADTEPIVVELLSAALARLDALERSEVIAAAQLAAYAKARELRRSHR